MNETLKKNYGFHSFRLEAVRIETRGDRKEFAKTLMAKGMMYPDRNN